LLRVRDLPLTDNPRPVALEERPDVLGTQPIELVVPALTQLVMPQNQQLPRGLRAIVPNRPRRRRLPARIDEKYDREDRCEHNRWPVRHAASV
jgi:hypothetical protein